MSSLNNAAMAQVGNSGMTRVSVDDLDKLVATIEMIRSTCLGMQFMPDEVSREVLKGLASVAVRCADSAMEQVDSIDMKAQPIYRVA